MASKASEILRDSNSSKIAKSLAASALAQSSTKKETGKEMETKASNVMKSDKYSDETKGLAASLVSQSNKKGNKDTYSMGKLNLNSRMHEVGSGINIYGYIEIDGIKKDFVCTVSYEFLQDINGGSTEYLDTCHNNFFTIEQIVEDKLKYFSVNKLDNKIIKIQVTSEDRHKYNL